MEIFRFIKWWWLSISPTMRPVIIVPIFLISMILAGTIFGSKGLLMFLSVILGSLILVLIYALYRVVTNKYAEYQEYKVKEADEIVRKLKGDR